MDRPDLTNQIAPRVLEEVLVTAQKIGATNTRETPIAISALNEDIIEKHKLAGSG